MDTSKRNNKTTKDQKTLCSEVPKYERGARGTAKERNEGLVQLIMTMPEYQLI